MSRIENIKSYSGQVLDNIFFRPMLTGKSAEELGIKVLYNMPVPTTLHFWKREDDVLKKYTSGGWNGSKKSSKFQKTIKLNKVKAELGYAADDYFSTVYELVTGRSDVNLDDLSGTELEEAETTLFRASIAESIRATMWYGDNERTDGTLATFDGVVKRIMEDAGSSDIATFGYIGGSSSDWAEKVLKKLWDNAPEELKAMRSEGQLAFFVTSDVYNAYEEHLDNVAIEAAYLAKQNGREALYYRGIPVVDVQLTGYCGRISNLPHSFAFLTDRRNIALAVNTNDVPGTEVRMWYNPDLMENRQRAVFMAGCDYLLPELLSVAVGVPLTDVKIEHDGEQVTVRGGLKSAENWVESISFSAYDSNGNIYVDGEELNLEDGYFESVYEMPELAMSEMVVCDTNGTCFLVEFKHQ